MSDKTILILGTGDTKSDEMRFIADCITGQGARPLVMDVGVLGEPEAHVDITRHEVAEAANTTNADIIALGDENLAMAKTSEGAAALAQRLQQAGKVHGILILGGTMGTDLALDVCNALPMGFPKVIVTTVAFSPLLPGPRIAPDVMMILWAGGLYGLNAICKSSLSQAAGAVVGAARAVEAPDATRPVIGMTSLGTSSLKYIKALKPALEARGFEVAIFHTTGMGGQAFEALAAKGAFACVMDFSLVEVSNHLHGSVVSAGATRLTAAGRAGIPQIIAPGGVSLIDMQAWADPDPRFEGREIHAHNRLIACALMSHEEKAQAGREIAEKAAAAKGPVRVLMPIKGIDEWDRPGGPFHDPDGLAQLAGALSEAPGYEALDLHINDTGFAERALEILDGWIAEGTVPRP